jgi:hypothetical protein
MIFKDVKIFQICYLKKPQNLTFYFFGFHCIVVDFFVEIKIKRYVKNNKNLLTQNIYRPLTDYFRPRIVSHYIYFVGKILSQACKVIRSCWFTNYWMKLMFSVADIIRFLKQQGCLIFCTNVFISQFLLTY